MADVVLAHGVAAVMGEMEGVDRCGRAFSAYRSGHVDTRQARLVVYAVWNSSRQAASTLFGEGWRVPMLESRMYPIGVDAYEMLRAGLARSENCPQTIRGQSKFASTPLAGRRRFATIRSTSSSPPRTRTG